MRVGDYWENGMRPCGEGIDLVLGTGEPAAQREVKVTECPSMAWALGTSPGQERHSPAFMAHVI